VKLPAHRAGLPGKEMSFLIVPLDPAYKAGLAGHLPVKKSYVHGCFLSIRFELTKQGFCKTKRCEDQKIKVTS
jgi:hypothetical protein